MKKYIKPETSITYVGTGMLMSISEGSITLDTDHTIDNMEDVLTRDELWYDNSQW